MRSLKLYRSYWATALILLLTMESCFRNRLRSHQTGSYSSLLSRCLAVIKLLRMKILILVGNCWWSRISLSCCTSKFLFLLHFSFCSTYFCLKVSAKSCFCIIQKLLLDLFYSSWASCNLETLWQCCFDDFFDVLQDRLLILNGHIANYSATRHKPSLNFFHRDFVGILFVF